MKPEHPIHSQTDAWLSLLFLRQRNKDIEGMEAMLDLEFVDLWWWTLARATQTHHITAARCALERTLQKAGLVSEPPERPSERAMRMADQASGDGAGQVPATTQGSPATRPTP